MPGARVRFAPLDLERTFVMHRLGAGDPTAAIEPGRLVKAFHAGAGVVVLSLAQDGDEVTVTAEGPGAEAVLAGWLRHLPPDDGPAAFAPEHPLVRRLHRERPGLRVVRVPWLFDVACSAVLQQRVTLGEAREAWRRIARAHGERSELGLAWPAPARLAEVPGWELERLGVDPKRARALVTLAREEARRPFLSVVRPSTTAPLVASDPGLRSGRTEHDVRSSTGALGTAPGRSPRGRSDPDGHAALRDRLLSLRGLGAWTAEMVLGFGAGDPDAVLVGDLHAPHVVAWALAREPRGSDARMLELLEPFRGQRFRVTRLLLGGPFTAPRLGRAGR